MGIFQSAAAVGTCDRVLEKIKALCIEYASEPMAVQALERLTSEVQTLRTIAESE